MIQRIEAAFEAARAEAVRQRLRRIAKLRIGQIVDGCAKVRAVEHVEDFGPQAQPDTLVQPDAPLKREIDLKGAEPSQRVAAKIALLSRRCEFAATHDIQVACTVDQAVEELSRGSALALFRIVQEALGNAAKHASPHRITVRLRRVADVVSLVISDDGPGFEPSWRSAGGSGGLGLLMMRERATQLNGTFEFETAPGRGTRIKVTIPFR